MTNNTAGLARKPMPLRRSLISAAIFSAFGMVATTSQAQSTSGAMQGITHAGATVTVTNTDTGQSRVITAGSDGRFSLATMQPGHYTIESLDHGNSDTRHIQVLAGKSTAVSLGLSAPSGSTTAAGGATNLTAVSVQASTPVIDTSSVQVNTTFTAEQLKELPIARNQTAAALLAPGAVRGDSAFGNLASFSGASVAENSYYVNGFNTTNYYQSLTSAQVPYEAIDQEDVQDGGYGAEYGNSTGGVVSVQTKRGTNQWKGGVDYTITPTDAMASQPNVYLKNGAISSINSKNSNYLMQNNSGNGVTHANPVDFNNRWNAWIGGPLIKDKLFFFGLVSDTHTGSNAYGSWFNNGGDTTQTQAGASRTSMSSPYWLVKVDWNINSRNILEYTGYGNQDRYSENVYNYGFNGKNNASPYLGEYLGNVYNRTGGNTNILKYTSYVTDDLTFTAQYGKSGNDRINYATAANGTRETYDGNINNAASSPGCPNIVDQRTPVTSGLISPYSSCAFAGNLNTPNGHDSNLQLRFDVDYKIAGNDITAGWGRMRFTSSTGSAYEGGALYDYYSIPESILGHAPTGSPADSVVRQVTFATGADLALVQKYYYLQDVVNLTDNLVLRVGVRNDSFDNYNGSGEAYVRQGHSWQPRLGIAWDVFGDGDTKIYASAGDYSLPLDEEVAMRGASASLYGYQYYSYTGVDPKTGKPLGLGALPAAYAAAYPSHVGQQYYNGETGATPNPKASASTNLRPFKQREFILGAQQKFDDWVVGAKLMYRKVLTGTDDDCDVRPVYAYMNKHYGLNLPTDSLAPTDPNVPGGCFIFNPGSSVSLLFPADASGKLYPVNLTAAQVGEPKYRRNYESVQLTAEKVFDHNWYLNLSYVWAKERGNTEGLVNSTNGQSDTGTSYLFDYPELMQGSNGLLPNDHRHTFKAYGAWRATPQWLFGVNAYIQSGRPENCLGLNPIDNTLNGGYGNTYFYCDGMVMAQGSAGTTPWIWNLDMNVEYDPSWAKGLKIRANIYNIFNKQRYTTINETGEDANGASLAGTTYKVPTSFQTPRYIQLQAEYDFSL